MEYYAIIQDLIENIHAVDDNDLTALLDCIIKECDRRFIDYEDTIEDAIADIEREAQEVVIVSKEEIEKHSTMALLFKNNK